MNGLDERQPTPLRSYSATVRAAIVGLAVGTGEPVRLKVGGSWIQGEVISERGESMVVNHSQPFVGNTEIRYDDVEDCEFPNLDDDSEYC